MCIFALGETILSPTSSALLTDLAPEQLRGRYTATGAFVIRIAAVAGPAVAGILLGSHLGAAFVMVVVGTCLAMIALLRRLEAVLSARANGVEGEPAA